MGTELDISFVKQSYQRMSDEELIQTATVNAFGLTPRGLEVVLEEIKHRNLDNKIANAVRAQNKVYTIEEIDQYCDLIRNLNCPACGSSAIKLNGTMTSQVMSFLLITYYNERLIIACPACLDKANEHAVLVSSILGWWGIPWGLIRTIKAIRENIKSKRTHHDEFANNYLRSFALQKIGQLERFKDDKVKIQQIISEE